MHFLCFALLSCLLGGLPARNLPRLAEADGEIDDFDCFSSKLESPLVALDYVKTRWCCS